MTTERQKMKEVLKELVESLDELDAAVEDQRFGYSELKEIAFNRFAKARANAKCALEAK